MTNDLVLFEVNSINRQEFSSQFIDLVKTADHPDSIKYLIQKFTNLLTQMDQVRTKYKNFGIGCFYCEQSLLNHEQLAEHFNISEQTSKHCSQVYQRLIKLQSEGLDIDRLLNSGCTWEAIRECVKTANIDHLKYLNHAIDRGLNWDALRDDIYAENPKLLGSRRQKSDAQKKLEAMEKKILDQDDTIRLLSDDLKQAKRIAEIKDKEHNEAWIKARSESMVKHSEEMREKAEKENEQLKLQVSQLATTLKAIQTQMSSQPTVEQIEAKIKADYEQKYQDSLNDAVNARLKEESAKLLQSNQESMQTITELGTKIDSLIKENKQLKALPKVPEITTGKALIELMSNLPRAVLLEAYNWLKKEIAKN